MTRARKLEVVAWILAGLCVAAFLVTILHYQFGVGLGRNYGGCAGGCLIWDHRPTAVSIQPFFDGNGPELMWRARIFRSRPVATIVIVPLWLPFVMLSIVAALAHRRARRPKPGTCEKCSYNLTGNTSGVCPECGTIR